MYAHLLGIHNGPAVQRPSEPHVLEIDGDDLSLRCVPTLQ